MQKKIGLRTTIIVCSVLASLLPFLVSMAIMISHETRNYRDMVYNSMKYAMDTLSSNVETLLSNAWDASLYPLTNPSIQSFLSWDNSNQPESIRDYEERALSAIVSLPLASDYIHYYMVERMDGTSIRTGPGYYTISDSEKQKAIEMDGKAVWSVQSSAWSAYSTSTYGAYISVYRLLRDTPHVSRHLGFSKLYIEIDAFKEYLKPIKDLPVLKNYIVDSDGKVLINDGSNTPGLSFPGVWLEENNTPDRTVTFDNTDYLVYVRHLKMNDWCVISFLPVSYVNQVFMQFSSVLPLSVISFVLSCALLSLVLSRVLFVPIRSISQLMDQVGNGQYELRTKVRGPREIVWLQQSFNEMTAHLEKLYNENYMYNIKLRDAQIKELQTRINPHFLYNTLNSIYWMSSLNGMDNLSLMVSSLSELLKISLNSDPDGLIPFQTEHLHIGYYITIQQIRFRDSIQIHMQCEEQIEQYRVLPLILQPLVENAISHGIEPKSEGNVWIRVFTEKNMLVYLVEDDGVGMSREQFELIVHAQTSGHSSSGMALKNIYDRLRLKYGDPFGIVLLPRPEGGSIFRVTQPIQDECSSVK